MDQGQSWVILNKLRLQDAVSEDGSNLFQTPNLEALGSGQIEDVYVAAVSQLTLVQRPVAEKGVAKRLFLPTLLSKPGDLLAPDMDLPSLI